MRNTRRKNFRNFKRLNGGITLIALVITIIVLLILAGVSIAMLTGDNGILNKANEAKTETEYASAKEKVQIAVLGSYGNDGTLSLDELKTQVANEGGSVIGDSFPVTVTMDGHSFTVDSNGKITENGATGGDDTPTVGDLSSVTGNETTNTIVQDKLGNQVKIPSGFKVVNPTETVPDGIVIEDVTRTATAGSQFVWIPVGEVKKADGTTETINLSRYTFDENGDETNQGDNKIKSYYVEEEPSDSDSDVPPTPIPGGKNTIAKDINDFKTKATASGGYYIGRYEARDGTTTSARTSSTSDTNQITCKADDYVYNYVTQPQAATLSRNMYSDSNFESDLVNSYAWDTAIVYLQAFDNREDKTTPYSRRESLNTVNAATQGTNKLDTQDIICNIYDMASNVEEWTTETGDTDAGNEWATTFTTRGGLYYNYSRGVFTSYRSCISSVSREKTGFRILIYL